jgi:hypothetical protein
MLLMRAVVRRRGGHDHLEWVVGARGEERRVLVAAAERAVDDV